MSTTVELQKKHAELQRVSAELAASREVIAALVAGGLRRHVGCVGDRHVLGRPECLAYDEAMALVGMPS